MLRVALWLLLSVMFSFHSWADTSEEEGWGTVTGIFTPRFWPVLAQVAGSHALGGKWEYDTSCSCLSFPTWQMKQWGREFCSWMKAGEFCRGITEIREGEFGEGEMYNVHDTVCLFLLIVILNTISLKLSSHFSFFGYSCQNKNVILSMKTEVLVEKLQLELWELWSWGIHARTCCVCMYKHMHIHFQ